MSKEVTYLRARELADVLSVAVSTVWKWEKAGVLPRGTRITPRCTVWKLEEVEEFIAAMRAEQERLNHA